MLADISCIPIFYTTFVLRLVKILAGQLTIGTASLTRQAKIILI